MCAKQLFIAADRIDGDQRARRSVQSRRTCRVERESWWAFAFFTPAAAALAPTDSSPGSKEGRKERRKRCRGSARWSVDPSVTRARGRSMRHRGY